MIKKRIEPIVNTKDNLKEYFYEILEKGDYIYLDSNNIAFSNAFFELVENLKNKLKILFEKMNYKFTYVYDDEQIKLLNGKQKYCYFRHLNKYLNIETFTLEGVSSHDTEYLAKGEIFSILDSIDKFTNETLNIPLVYGKDLYEEKYCWYAFLPNNEAIKVGELSYFEECHKVNFKLNFGLFITSILINSDEKGLVIPFDVSPIQVAIIPKNKAKIGTMELCKKVLNELYDYRVILDESEENYGYKNVSYDLKGVPFKVIVSISEGQEKLTLVSRYTKEKEEVSIEELKELIYVKSIKTNKLMLKNNRKSLDSNSEINKDTEINY